MGGLQVLEFLKVDEAVSVHGAVRTGSSFPVRDTVPLGSLLSVYTIISSLSCFDGDLSVKLKLCASVF